MFLDSGHTTHNRVMSMKSCHNSQVKLVEFCTYDAVLCVLMRLFHGVINICTHFTSLLIHGIIRNADMLTALQKFWLWCIKQLFKGWICSHSQFGPLGSDLRLEVALCNGTTWVAPPPTWAWKRIQLLKRCLLHFRIPNAGQSPQN